MHLRKIRWSVEDIATQIHALSAELNSPYNDGFTAWGCKQDLLIIQTLINDALKDAPEFGDLETDWLKEQEQKRIIKILKE